MNNVLVERESRMDCRGDVAADVKAKQVDSASQSPEVRNGVTQKFERTGKESRCTAQQSQDISLSHFRSHGAVAWSLTPPWFRGIERDPQCPPEKILPFPKLNLTLEIALTAIMSTTSPTPRPTQRAFFDTAFSQ